MFVCSIRFKYNNKCEQHDLTSSTRETPSYFLQVSSLFQNVTCIHPYKRAEELVFFLFLPSRESMYTSDNEGKRKGSAFVVDFLLVPLLCLGKMEVWKGLFKYYTHT